MRNEFLDEIRDTLFAVAVAGAIGLSAANLAIQVNKERAAFGASAASALQALPCDSPAAVPAEAEIAAVLTDDAHKSVLKARAASSKCRDTLRLGLGT